MGHHRRGLFDFFGDSEHGEHHGGHDEHHGDYGHHSEHDEHHGDYGHHGHHDYYHDDYQDHHHTAYEPTRPQYADEDVIPTPDTAPALTGDRAIAALRERFARGEIDRTEYEERLAILEGRPAL